MKELSIEEKAKHYDEVREKIAIRFGSNVADEIFSQFEVSEDERIRKELIGMVKEDWPGRDDVLAWLDEQGEHANFRNKIQIGDKVTRNKDGVLVNLSQLNRVAKKDEKQCEQPKKHDVCDNCDQQGCCVSPCPMKLVEKHGEQKPAWSEEDELSCFESALFTAFSDAWQFYLLGGEVNVKQWAKEHSKELLKAAKEELKEQKPVEWSEEDRRMLIGLIDELDAIMNKATSNEISVYSKYTNWLKSLKDRVQPQPKQEWSEEDERIRQDAIRILSDAADRYTKDSCGCTPSWARCIPWLKSLRSQKQWKPSDLPHWKKSTLPNDNTTGFNSDYFCYKGYNINYKELFEKLPKDD